MCVVVFTLLILFSIQQVACQYKLAEPIVPPKEIAHELFVLRPESQQQIEGPLVVCAYAVFDMKNLLHGNLANELNLEKCRQTGRYQASCVWKEAKEMGEAEQKRHALDTVCHGLKSGENYFWGHKYSILFRVVNTSNNLIKVHGTCETDSDTTYFGSNFQCDDDFKSCRTYFADAHETVTAVNNALTSICETRMSGKYFIRS